MNKQKCRFCEGMEPMKSIYIGPGQKTMTTMLGMLVGSDRSRWKTDCVFYETDGKATLIGFESSSGEYAPQYVEIQYCPFCGKRLSNDSKENNEPI